MSILRSPVALTVAIMFAAHLLSSAALADEPIVIDGLYEDTLFLPTLGEVIVLGPDGAIETSDGRGIEANVATTITIDGGRVETGSGNAIWTRTHTDLKIINGAEILPGANTALNLSEHARVLIRDSQVDGHLSADDSLDVEITNSSIGNIRGDSNARIRLVNSTANDIRVNDDVEVEIINSTLVDRLRFDSNVMLFVDEQSTLYERVDADHNLDFELRGTIDFDSSDTAAISGHSNFNVHLRGGSIIGSSSGQRGFGIGQAGTIRLSEGASIEVSSHAIEMTDSGTIVLEPGSLLSSSDASAIRHLNALTLSADDATLIGDIYIGRSSIVSLHNTTLVGQERGLRVERGSRVTLTGESTSLSSANRRVIELGDGSRMTMMAGEILAPADSEFCRGIDINRGASATIYGGSVHTLAEECEAVEMNRARLVMVGGSFLSEGENAPGVYSFRDSRVRFAEDASITTTGDRIVPAASTRGAHGMYGQNSVFEMEGGQIDIQGSGNFGLLGLDRSIFVVSAGQVFANPTQNSYSLGVFEESEIRLLGLADQFTYEIDGSGEGPQTVTVGVGDSVSLSDLYPDFADGNQEVTGVISGMWAHGETFEMSFSNQYDTLDEDPLPPGDIILRGVAEPDPSTEATISSQNNPSEVHETVLFTVDVTNPLDAPDDGQVTVMASSGESCEGENPIVSGNTVTWTCEITFDSVGTRAVSAEFSDSEQFEDSASPPLTQTVNLGLFIDRFEEDEIENG